MQGKIPGNLGHQSALSWPGGCHSILFLLFEGSMVFSRVFVASFLVGVIIGDVVKVPSSMTDASPGFRYVLFVCKSE